MDSLLAMWKATKGRHPALSKDAKFQPDKLTPLCAKFDEDAKKFGEQEKEKKKALEIITDTQEKIRARMADNATGIDTIKTMTSLINNIKIQDLNLTADDVVDKFSKACEGFESSARGLGNAATSIAKSDEVGKAAKLAADKFKAKRASIDAAQKKLSADGKKLGDEIKRLVGVYEKIATDLKDSKMADDIGHLVDVLVQQALYNQ